MPIEVKCDHCGKLLKAPDSLAGKNARCPTCGTLLVVPVADVLDAEVVEPQTAAPASEYPDVAGVYGDVTEDQAATDPDTRRPCPACGEMIPLAAAKCRFCDEVFDATLRRRTRDVNPTALAKFRKEMHGLGGIWIFFGLLVTAVAIFLIVSNKPLNAELSGSALGAILLVMGAVYFVAGLFTAMKQMWAVYIGLVISYLSLFGNLIGFNICGLVIMVLVVVQAHRCIKAAGKFQAAGISLTARPDELRSRAPDPELE